MAFLLLPIYHGTSTASSCAASFHFLFFVLGWPSALFTLLVCQLLSTSGQDDGHHGLPSQLSKNTYVMKTHNLSCPGTCRAAPPSWPNVLCLVRAGTQRMQIPFVPLAIPQSSILCAALPSTICHPTDTHWCTNGKITTLKSLSVFYDKA